MFISFLPEAFGKLTSTLQRSLDVVIIMSDRVIVMAVQEQVRCCLNLQTASAQRTNTAFKVMIKSVKMA